MIPTQTLSKFLEEQGYQGQLQEAFYNYLKDLGFTGTLNEKMYKWFKGLGYEGALPEMLSFWLEGYVPIPEGPMSDTLRVQTGSYLGTGNRIDVPLGFEPDLVFVWADTTTQPLVWKADLPWHGRSQRLDAGDSAYHLCRFGGERFENFKGNGFGALPTYSVSGRTYHFAAIRYNGSKAVSHTSIIGNAVTRDLLYTDWLPDLTLIKRDSPQPAVLTLTGKVPEQTTTAAGALAGAVEHILGGVRLSGANQVNQNTPPGLGEGIEHMAFRASNAVSILEYTGDGAASRSLGIAADFALIVPVAQATPTVAAIPGAARGVSGESVSGFVVGSDLTVPGTHNATGTVYRVLALRDTAQALRDTSVPIPTVCGIVGEGSAKLSDSFSLSGPCTLEFWGRPRGVIGTKWFMPLLMAGNAADPGAGYSAGIYGYAADPDSHGWSGASLRWIQHNRLARERVSPYASINRYNLNSGIVQAVGDPVHMVLVHHGAGLWRLFINGKLAKEHNRSMALETGTLPGVQDGGDGVARPLYLFSAMLGSTEGFIPGEVYRVQAWQTGLSDDHAKALYKEVRGEGVSIPAARDTWDFRTAVPPGVTGVVAGVPGQEIVYTPPTIGTDWTTPAWKPGSNTDSTAGVSTREDGALVITAVATSGNPRVYFDMEDGAQYELETVVEWGDATRVIARQSNTEGLTGDTVFDITRPAGDTTLTRSDTFTVNAGKVALHYVFVMAKGKTSAILPTTRVRRLS